jgi:hypothetical protein
LRAQVENLIVDLLDESLDLRSEGSRHLLADLVERRTGVRLQIPDYPTSRQWFFGLVGACSRRSNSLAALVAAVDGLQPGSARVVALRRLQDEWDASEVAEHLPADLWSKLAEELGLIDCAEVLDAYLRATNGRIPGPPPHCATAWHVFVRLLGFNASPRRLPPYLAFLSLVSDRLDPSTAQQVDVWSRRRAHAWNCSAELADVTLQRTRRTNPDATSYLIFQFEPDGVDRNLYIMSWWHQVGIPDAAFEPGERWLLSKADLERAVEEVISAVEALLATHRGMLAIEFILPFDMLNVPVDWWYKESNSALPKPLAMDYSVTLRSLERLRTPQWHRVWHRRWEGMIREPRASRAHWSVPSGVDHLSRLEAALASDEQVAALVLSEPPHASGEVGRHEVAVALRVGLPVVIWNRSVRVDRDMEALRAFLESGVLADLPRRVRRLRLDALGLEPDNRDEHLGRNLAVLWDDPERRVGSFPDSAEGEILS